MSRIDYVDCDDNESFLRACAFSANTERHLKGEKGQKALKELEEALLALPEKKLIYFNFVTRKSILDEVGEVCALGAVALKRRMDKGMTRAQAIRDMEEKAPEGPDYIKVSAWESIEETSEFLKLKPNFVWSVVEQNDEQCGNKVSPEDRYRHVLEWVQKRIAR